MTKLLLLLAEISSQGGISCSLLYQSLPFINSEKVSKEKLSLILFLSAKVFSTTTGSVADNR